jgi:hypothetical protein
MTGKRLLSETFEDIEYVSLKREVMLRIAFQNVHLLLSTLIFSAFSALIILWPSVSWRICAAHGVVSGALSLQWCHHGSVQVLLKKYIMMKENILVEEGSVRAGSTWEIWLLANHMTSFLGSRWLVSTKGVFIGLQISMILLASAVASAVNGPSLLASLLLLAGTSLVLFTNPKGTDLAPNGKAPK